METRISRGEATGYDLSRIEPLLRPRHMDEWGVERPGRSDDFLRLSAELAATAYDMDVTPWLQAGWRDVTVQVDGDLTGGIEAAEENPDKPLRGLGKLLNALKLRRVRQQLQKPGPIGTMLGAVRQLKTSSTGKAVVMLHPTEDGRYVVAIGFTGTGRRLYDWFPNFRLTAENGFHQGFLQLCRQFEGNEDAITFPETAAALGLEKLTLRHILQECTQPDSRFLIWTAGHSQGAAIMQVWAHSKLNEEHVLPGNIIGCGFASPSTVQGTATEHPEQYPLYHVVNSDDAIPRMGAMMHLGQVLVYPAGEGVRGACYRYPMTPDDLTARMAARPFMVSLRDTPSCLIFLSAMLDVLQFKPAEEIGATLGLLNTNPVSRRVLSTVDGRVSGMLQDAVRRCEAAYLSITGRRMPLIPVRHMRWRLLEADARYGIRAVLQGMAQLSGSAHTMFRGRDGAMGAYAYIASCGAQQLRPAIWQSGTRPILLFADGRMPLLAARNERRPRRVHAVPHRAARRSAWKR